MKVKCENADKCSVVCRHKEPHEDQIWEVCTSLECKVGIHGSLCNPIVQSSNKPDGGAK
jgi:hypothetical protein